MNSVSTFIQKVIGTHSSGHAREHSYRPALKELFEQTTSLNVINEPRRSEYGAPDFVFLKGKTVIAYAEAKDIDISLDEIEKSEQMVRYYGYSNIILTNGLDFRFYRNGSRQGDPIVIGELNRGSISINEKYFQLLTDAIGDFIKESKEPIKSGTVLSKVMAGKARRIRDNVRKFLEDENNPKNENLLGVYEVIKKLLLADLDHAKFADMYAQTIVYGLFVARYYDKTTDSFSRQEARDLVPVSNPFLRHFFDHIAGSSFDPRIEYIVNELCDEFNHADVQAIVHNYYKVDKDSSRDPIIHFYEDFLQEYDSNERKKMGVFYTPLPVVRFIVRAVDYILKKEFDLSQGLTDPSKIEITKEIQGKKHKIPVYKVQVLDPATGTGTFLNETILHIKKSFEGQEGRWSSYVNSDLLPRMHGFELMMASYTIAHLKLSSTIAETGAKIEDTRLGVYLTNSLEKAEIEENTLFGIGLGKAITEESNQANKVKNELPIMVVMGNPPYSVSSQNKSVYIEDLIKEYKKDLNEINIQPLSDDYIKFIRFSENLIEKNGEGIVAMITNNSFIDGVIHRQMRKHLLQTFDDIYILNLSPHNIKTDQNVFNIKQGVSINIFVKRNDKKKELGNVYYTELSGKRENKFESLNDLSIEPLKLNKLKYQEPYYFFVPKNFDDINEYEHGFKVNDIFDQFGSGVKFRKDNILVKNNYSYDECLKTLNDLASKEENYILKKYNISETSDWKIRDIKKYFIDIKQESIRKISYRMFSENYAYYDLENISKIIPRGDARSALMKHFILGDNIGLVTNRLLSSDSFQHVFVTKNITDMCYLSNKGKEAGYIFPLFLYADDGSKVPNLKKEIVNEIENIVGKTTPENILDYIYAVLHSPIYRETYKEFLKIDFPRVPYPENKEKFWKLVKLGEKLRGLHLMIDSEVNNFATTFPEGGTDEVEKISYKDGKVYINANQYFGNVPEIAWNFYIGGYQPAQKWLNDRKGRVLTNQDIEHYQKIVMVLLETSKIMSDIDKIMI